MGGPYQPDQVSEKRAVLRSQSRWAPLTASGDRVVGDSRYIQYRVELTSSQSGDAPVLSAIGFTHNGELPGSIGEIGGGAHE